jgi:hypothetical protein
VRTEPVELDRAQRHGGRTVERDAGRSTRLRRYLGRGGNAADHLTSRDVLDVHADVVDVVGFLRPNVHETGEVGGDMSSRLRYVEAVDSARHHEKEAVTDLAEVAEQSCTYLGHGRYDAA